MVDHRRVYAEDAEGYDRLVAAEDCDGALLPAIRALARLDGADVLEIGVGTGRVTRLLLEAGARVVGCEPAPAMLALARRRLAGHGALELLPVGIDDLRVAPGRFDVALAGWVLGHFVGWFPDDGRARVAAALEAMSTALRPGGTLIVIETLGTGRTEPAPPTRELAALFAWLEHERGFRRRVVRTDYAFPDVATAARVTGAFFGEEFAQRVREQGWTRVPECTGIWAR